MLPEYAAHTHPHTALRRAVALLLPADGAAEVHVAARDLTDHTHAGVCVCALPPTAAPGALRAIGDAMHRGSLLLKAKFAAPSGYHLAGVHEIAPTELSTGPRAAMVRHLKAGAILELHAHDGVRRVIDEVLDETGSDSALHFTSGGGAVARNGNEHLMRVSVVNTPAVDALRELAGHKHVPQIVATGNTCGASWTIETRLDGRRPHRIGRALATDVLAFCASLPRSSGPPQAPFDDLADLRAFLPERDRLWCAAQRRIEQTAGDASIARHGDLWIGNLLARRGRLTGVVDWDSWHPFSVPGADLLHLNHFELGAPFGHSVAKRPWVSASFREATELYWRSLRLRTTDDTLEAAGIAWLLGHLATAVRRDPDLAGDERWIDDNVDAVGEIL